MKCQQRLRICDVNHRHRHLRVRISLMPSQSMYVDSLTIHFRFHKPRHFSPVQKLIYFCPSTRTP